VRKLRTSIVWLGLVFATPSAAESARDAMQEFGLTGTWSADCSIDVTQSCASTRRCVGRLTFSAPDFRAARRDTVTPSFTGNGPVWQSWEILSATRVGERLRVVFRANQLTNGEFREIKGRYAFIAPTDGEEWETVYEKSGDKLRVWISERTDGGKINILNGEQMEPVSSWSEEQGPVRQWQRRRQQTIAPLERCTN